MKLVLLMLLTSIAVSTASCATMKPGSAPAIDCQNRVLITPTKREVMQLSRLTKQQILQVNETLARECGRKLAR